MRADTHQIHLEDVQRSSDSAGRTEGYREGSAATQALKNN